MNFQYKFNNKQTDNLNERATSPVNIMENKTGEIIRQKRKESGLTQLKLAELSGVSQQRIQAIENGRHNLSFPAIENLLSVMGYEIKIVKIDLKD